MAAQIQKGHTYNPGDVVNAADLNAHVDNATALAGMIGEQATESPLLTTSEVLVKLAAGGLRRRAVSTLPSGVTSIVFTMPTNEYTVHNVLVGGVATIGVDWHSGGFAANKVLAAPASSSGAPSFRVLTIADVTPGFVNISGAVIDWSLSNVFAKVMTGNHTFSFSNVKDGQSIKVRIQQQSPTGNFDANWPAGILWRGNVVPQVSQPPGQKDIYSFTAIGSTVYGYSEKNFA